MPNRIFYAVQAVGIAPTDSTSFVALKGVQSVGMTTAFNLEQVFELGQISLYENIENVPDVQMTIERVLDGTCPAYLRATENSVASTMSARSAKKCMAALSLYDDAQDSASGTPTAQVSVSGVVVGSVSYNFTAEGNFTESVTLLANNRLWLSGGYTFAGGFDNTDSPPGLGGVNRREDMLFTPTVVVLDTNGQLADPNCTILPGGTNGIPGISSSGVNLGALASSFSSHVSRIGVSFDFGRTEIFELGRRVPYFRFANFPVEVSTEIEVTTTNGDQVSSTEAGYISSGVNLQNKSIRIAIREGLRINLGTKNKLSNISYGGGDTGGGQATVTFTYTNFNDCTVSHTGDVTVALRNSYYNPG